MSFFVFSAFFRDSPGGFFTCTFSFARAVRHFESSVVVFATTRSARLCTRLAVTLPE
jgi:hypothetical protein